MGHLHYSLSQEDYEKLLVLSTLWATFTSAFLLVITTNV